jgi:hypothetical protein
MRIAVALGISLLVGCLAVARSARADPQGSARTSSTVTSSSAKPSAYTAGAGFQVAETGIGSLNFAAYIVIRYVNQLLDSTKWYDHTGQSHPLKARNDIQAHRIMLYTRGWVLDPRLSYSTTVWTINSSIGNPAYIALIANLSFRFSDAFSISGGIGPTPSNHSLMLVFPFFLGTDRRMVDEYLRAGFTGGVWVDGEPISRLHYKLMVGDNLSILGINANQLTRYLTYSAAIYWEPTTGEFGPRAGYSDFEIHEELATRFSTHFTYSRQSSQTDQEVNGFENTSIRLSDGVSVYTPGILAPGVMVNYADMFLFAAFAGIKYQGLALTAEYFFRWVGDFRATGPLPLASFLDNAFQAQAAYELIPQALQLYAGGSADFSRFNNPWDAAFGVNVFPFGLRSFALNAELAYFHKAAGGGLFVPYQIGQTGPTIDVSAWLLL